MVKSNSLCHKFERLESLEVLFAGKRTTSIITTELLSSLQEYNTRTQNGFQHTVIFLIKILYKLLTYAKIIQKHSGR